MSLEDLRPSIEAFLSEDQEERARRKGFDAKWSAHLDHNGFLNDLLRQAASLFSAYPAFEHSAVKTHNMNVTLHVSFKGAAGAIEYALSFEPDEQRQYIVCRSTLNGETSLDLEKVRGLAEARVRSFIATLLDNLRGKQPPS